MQKISIFFYKIRKHLFFPKFFRFKKKHFLGFIVHNFHAKFQVSSSKNGRVIAVGTKEDLLVPTAITQQSNNTEPTQDGLVGVGPPIIT